MLQNSMVRIGRSLPVAALAGVLFGLAPASAQEFAPEPPEPPEPPMVFALRGGTIGGGSYLGVGAAEIGNERAKALKLSDVHGVELTSVEEDSPAAKAGLKAGDAVLEYNGQRVEGLEQFIRLVRETPPGREVKLLISREGATQTVTATINARKMKVLRSPGNEWSFNMPEIAPMPPMPNMPELPRVFSYWQAPRLGVETEALGKQLAGFFGVKEGVLVRAVIKDSAAEKAGLKAGDVILKLDGNAVSTPEDLTSAVRSARSKKTYIVDVMRDRHEMPITVTQNEEGSEAPSPKAVRSRPVKM